MKSRYILLFHINSHGIVTNSGMSVERFASLEAATQKASPITDPIQLIQLDDGVRQVEEMWYNPDLKRYVHTYEALDDAPRGLKLHAAYFRLTDPKTLELLANDTDSDVLKNLSRNPGIPLQVAMDLTENDDPSLMISMLSTGETNDISVSLILAVMRAARKKHDRNNPANWLSIVELAEHMLSSHKDLPLGIALSLTNSPRVHLREKLAGHTKFQDVLNILASDENKEVARAARENVGYRP